MPLEVRELIDASLYRKNTSSVQAHMTVVSDYVKHFKCRRFIYI